MVDNLLRKACKSRVFHPKMSASNKSFELLTSLIKITSEDLIHYTCTRYLYNNLCIEYNNFMFA